jgi:sugar-specific transcriptional regulator TrmB
MNKKKLKMWLKKLEDEMAAAAFAEEGEFEAAREILKEQRKILLALSGEKSDFNAFRYAHNICKRIGAGLEILYSKHQDTDFLKEFQHELEKEGIEYNFIPTEGCIKEEILNYTDKRGDILFVVIESSEGFNINCKKSTKVVSESWKHLKCPLVVVSDLATA